MAPIAKLTKVVSTAVAAIMEAIELEESNFKPDQDDLVWEFSKLTVSDAKQQLILALPLDGGILLCQSFHRNRDANLTLFWMRLCVLAKCNSSARAVLPGRSAERRRRAGGRLRKRVDTTDYQIFSELFRHGPETAKYP